MNKKITILGIESSCDETAVSVVQEENGKTKILSNIVSSQFDIHKEFGGVVPELAARAHVEKIDLIAEKAISESKINLEDIDAVATTAGPGLIVCLTVGLNFGKTIAASFIIMPTPSTSNSVNPCEFKKSTRASCTSDNTASLPRCPP